MGLVLLGPRAVDGYRPSMSMSGGKTTTDVRQKRQQAHQFGVFLDMVIFPAHIGDREHWRVVIKCWIGRKVEYE